MDFLKNRRKAVIASVLAVVLVVLVVFSFAFAYCRNIRAENRVDKPYYSENRVNKPYYSRLKFSISLLDQLQKDDPNENIFYSPHSVYSTLSLAYLGAAGETEKELGKLLGLESKADVVDAYKLKKEQSNRFQNQSIIEFISADKLYVSKTMKMR